MPVGCLGDNSTLAGSVHNVDAILTSSVLNSAEQFAFMQQTLLLQIFRVQQPLSGSNNNSVHTNELHPPENGVRSPPESDTTPSGNPSAPSSSCPTCMAFSDQCCQLENGHDLFQEFVEINLQCFWNAKLTEALANLRYQGYVCPGILVMIANTSYLESISDAWKKRLLIGPPTCRISQFGISNGCIVKPVLQTHSIALPDIICLILARLKQRNQVAEMETICTEVERDWGGINKLENVKETVHTALGQLIKQRKVYYTGNKGYFLVQPSDFGSPFRGLGNRLNKFRHSLRDKTALFNGKLKVDQECQTGAEQEQPSPTLSPELPKNLHNSSNSSNENSFNLERSQSLRFSKKSLRNMSRGGSLRLSKKDAMIFKEEDEESEILTSTKLSPYPNGSVPDSSISLQDSSNGNKSNFERKNSFLGKLFSKRKPSSPSGCTPTPKPELGSFSAQFPPPELVEHYNAIYTPIRKPSSTPKFYNQPPQLQSSPSRVEVSPTAQVRNGPNGNFVIYERNNQRDPQSPQNYTRNSNNNTSSPIYGQSREDPHLLENYVPTSSPIYGQGRGDVQALQNYSANNTTSSPIYGQSRGGEPQPPQSYTPSGTSSPMYGPGPGDQRQTQNYVPNHNSSPVYGRGQQRHKPQETMYSNPPPPLPYRPPPPNPYCHANKSPVNGVWLPHQSNVSKASPQVQRNQRAEANNLTDYGIQSSDFSSSNTSSSSGPSSIDSQTPLHQRLNILNQNKNIAKEAPTTSLYDDTLAVIEKSNKELESKLSPQVRRSQIATQQPRIDTIHNNNNLVQEVIYEIEPDLSRSSSQSTIKPGESSAPSYPSLNDLSLHEVGNNFKSLTAQKLMAGISFNSIDTLLEVNAVADARKKLNESTETVDFGVI